MRFGVKMLPANKVCVVDEGKVYLFDQSGKCVSEGTESLAQYANGLVQLPIVSILSSADSAEIATFEGDTVHKFTGDMDSVDIVMNLQMKGDFLRMCMRKGQVPLDDHSEWFNQMIFIYTEGYPVEKLVTDELGFRRCEDEGVR